MRLYRVQHAEDERGPYQFGSGEENMERDVLVEEICTAHNDYWKNDRVRVSHPGPHEDGLGFMNGEFDGWLFACTSIETLHQWFAGFGEDLREQGYHVQVLDVWDDSVKFGKSGRQAIFAPGASQVITTREIGWV